MLCAVFFILVAACAKSSYGHNVSVSSRDSQHIALKSDEHATIPKDVEAMRRLRVAMTTDVVMHGGIVGKLKELLPNNDISNPFSKTRPSKTVTNSYGFNDVVMLERTPFADNTAESLALQDNAMMRKFELPTFAPLSRTDIMMNRVISSDTYAKWQKAVSLRSVEHYQSVLELKLLTEELPWYGLSSLTWKQLLNKPPGVKLAKWHHGADFQSVMNYNADLVKLARNYKSTTLIVKTFDEKLSMMPAGIREYVEGVLALAEQVIVRGIPVKDVPDEVNAVMIRYWFEKYPSIKLGGDLEKHSVIEYFVELADVQTTKLQTYHKRQRPEEDIVMLPLKKQKP
ncbi:hypothetical protein CCR75_002470 [Bremia lactucae]|uniref:RxLR effector protein n=1 Tax=Bremia lactucae TaxID=4779 RepID=A0A976FDW0_BRELC|nr:hypothetical protein CCR75_002470 [Bremia lactucae]